MYWQANFDAVMSLMKEAKEQEAPAFLCTVRGSVHISQSDFSVLYDHITSFFFKATVNPQRAIDLNIRYVTLVARRLAFSNKNAALLWNFSGTLLKALVKL